MHRSWGWRGRTPRRRPTVYRGAARREKSARFRWRCREPDRDDVGQKDYLAGANHATRPAHCGWALRSCTRATRRETKRRVAAGLSSVLYGAIASKSANAPRRRLTRTPRPFLDYACHLLVSGKVGGVSPCDGRPGFLDLPLLQGDQFADSFSRRI